MNLYHYSTLKEISPKPETVLAIGMFDGLHKGHKSIFEALEQESVKKGLPKAIWTFSSKRAKSGATHLMSKKVYLEHLEGLGVSSFHEMDFIDEIKNMTAIDFFDKILIEKLNVQSVVLGEDAKLGKSRATSAEEFKVLGKKRGVDVILLPLLELEGDKVSSTRIRTLISSGKLEEAEALLGYAYSMTDVVFKDQQLGRTLGFPTANLRCQGLTFPPNGVYRCQAKSAQWSQAKKAIAYIGSRPTIFNSEGEKVLEIHFPDWSGDLYGQTLAVSKFECIRGEMKFDTLEDLKRQIEVDVKAL